MENTVPSQPPIAGLRISECEGYYEVENHEDGEILAKIHRSEIASRYNSLFRPVDGHSSQAAQDNAQTLPRCINLGVKSHGYRLVSYVRGAAPPEEKNETSLTLDTANVAGMLSLGAHDAKQLAQLLLDYHRGSIKNEQRGKSPQSWLIRLERRVS